ncbi:MAG: methyltransferase family protein [Solirubrobacteraceae bacterium]
MTDATRLFIDLCWAAWALYWLVMAFSTKRTVERRGFFGYRLVALACFAASFVVERLLHVSPQAHLWHTGLVLGVATDCIVLAGGVFTVWARVTLGRNWSAEVTFKEDHELTESGPYALARHPIYTGLLVMALGTAIDYGRALGVPLFLAICAALWWKARQEEHVMSQHFPDAYARYRSRVRAIIPFVL